MKKYRIIIADDHPIILMGIQHVLQKDSLLEIVAQATDSDSLVEKVKTLQPDMIITDYNMPGARIGDGAKLIAHLKRYFPETKILILTMITNPIILSSMVKSHVSGIIMKSASLDEVAKAVNKVKKGMSYYSNSIEDIIITHTQKNQEGTLESLSAKETEVLRLYLTGLSVSEIAHQLSRSIKTISAQKQSAMSKLGISTDKDLFEYAIKNELI